MRVLCGTCSPCVPPAVQAVESGAVRSGPEVVQVDVRRGDRGMSHPALNAREIDTPREPQASGGVAEVVTSTTPDSDVHPSVRFNADACS